MTSPLAYQPQTPLDDDRFVQQSFQGLFAAPWLGSPEPGELQRVQELALSLDQSASSHGDFTSILSHLLKIRVYCLMAVQESDQKQIQAYYTEAGNQCLAVMILAHRLPNSVPSSVAAWVQGVHTLIVAQKAMPRDMIEGQRLAWQAFDQLWGIRSALCAGAAADAVAAQRLATEPTAVARRLSAVPHRLQERLDSEERTLDMQCDLLNRRLLGVRRSREQALSAVFRWLSLNTLLMAAAPLNGRFFREIPWSVPFFLGQFGFWFYTWERPSRDGLTFFQWVEVLQRQALADFYAAVRGLNCPGQSFAATATRLLAQVRKDRRLLGTFCLGSLPQELDPLDRMKTMIEQGRQRLSGTWMADMRNGPPCPVADLLWGDAHMLPAAVRIRFCPDA